MIQLANGTPSNRTLAFFEARARGGIGMIIMGGGVATARAWDESPFGPVLRMNSDDLVNTFSRVTDAVHRRATKIIYQRSPSFGRMAKRGTDGPDLISASASNVVVPEDSLVRGDGPRSEDRRN